MTRIFTLFLIFDICILRTHANAIPSRVDVVNHAVPISQNIFKDGPRIVPRDDLWGTFTVFPPLRQSHALPDLIDAPEAVSLSPTFRRSITDLEGGTDTVASITRIRSITAAPGACKFAPATTVYITQTQREGKIKRDIQTVTQTIWQTATVTTTSYATETYFATTVSVTVQSPYIAYGIPTSFPVSQSNGSSCSTSPGAITDAQGCSMNVQQRNVVANYDSLPVSNHTFNFFDYSPYLGLNYSAFNIANNPVQADSASPPNYIISQFNLTGARRISVQAPFVAFSLLSFAFACSQSIPQVACNVLVHGVKASTTTASGASAGGLVTSELLYSPNATYNDGFRMVKTSLDEAEWSNLTQATFSAQIGGNEADLLIDDLEYVLSGSAEKLKSILG